MKLDLPEFKSEADEAKWWFDHQDEIADLYLQQHPEEFVAKSQPSLSVALQSDDAELLRKRAASCGLDPNQYASRLLHEALHRDLAA